MPIITDYINLFASNQISPKTALVYRQELRRFAAFVGVGIEDLTIGHVLDYRNSHNGLAPSTLSWKISVIRSFLTFLVQERVIPHNLALSVKSPRVRRHSRITDFGPSQFEQLVRGIDTRTASGHRNRCMIMAMGLLGLRVSEICGLRLGQVQQHGEQMVLSFTSKGLAHRLVPLIKNMDWEIAQFIDRHRLKQPATAPVFPARASDTRPLTTRAAAYMVGIAYRQTGLAGQLTPHDLRHFALSTLAAEGYDLFTIQTFAGHSQLATIAQYLHRLNQQRTFLNQLHKNSLIRNSKEPNHDSLEPLQLGLMETVPSQIPYPQSRALATPRAKA